MTLTLKFLRRGARQTLYETESGSRVWLPDEAISSTFIRADERHQHLVMLQETWARNNAWVLDTTEP